MKIKLTTTAIAILISGCASNPPQNHEYIPQEIGQKEITYPESIDRRAFLQELSESIIDLSKFKPTKYQNGLFFTKIETEQTPEGLNILFIRGDKDQGFGLHPTDSLTAKRKTISKVHVSLHIEETSGQTKVKVSTPSKVTESREKTIYFKEIEPVASPIELAADVKSSIQTANIEIKSSIEKEKEFTSKYPPESIAANFKRMERCEAKANEPKECLISGVRTSIAVSPYRTGTIVTARLKQDYIISPNSNNRAATEKKMEKAINRVNEIVSK